MIYNIDFIYKRHNILKLCDIVNITLLKNAYISYTDKANTNLLHKFVNSTYSGKSRSKRKLNGHSRYLRKHKSYKKMFNE